MTRCRSHHQPYPIYTTVLTGKNLPAHLGYRTKFPDSAWTSLVNKVERQSSLRATQQKIIQTEFRESEAQTDPYVVDVVEKNEGLEICTLNWLAWNYGLPAGANEIQSIERARQKRAWESALPHPFDKTTKEIRDIVVRAIEINEFKYREDTSATTSSLRIELAKKLMREKLQKDLINNEARLGKYVEEKKEEKNEKIKKLRLNFNREIRKLVFERAGIDKKYRKQNIVKQFTEKTSEMYAPQIRFGENPKYRHESINLRCGYWAAFRKLEILHHTINDVPVPLKPAFDFEKKSKPRTSRKSLCVRATKWSEQNLQKLHEELSNIRKRRHTTTRPCYLKRKIECTEIQFETPYVEGIPDEEEDAFQACLLLQKTVKGRAVQAVMFEGRVKCQELIEELKSTHALQNHAEDVKAQMRMKIYELQRQAEAKEIQNKRKDEILLGCEGKTIGDILDFLSKELLRLQNERKIHANALKADRERQQREAAEAGRRQEEEQRRREHDEMYKQIVKIHQNTAHAFLDEIFEESRNWLAHREARERTASIAKTIDRAAMEMTSIPIFARADDLKEEEIVADLIHNFALPEVEKRIVRKRLVDKQRNYLKVCHDEVYSAIEKVVQGTRTAGGELVPLPKTGKHKVPPMVRVKYLRLKRMHESSSSSVESKNSPESENPLQSGLLFESDDSKKNQEQPEKPEKEFWSSGFSKQKVIIEDSDSNEQNDL